jgi:hypothetical protein
MTTDAAVIACALQLEFSQERETGHFNVAKSAERIFTLDYRQSCHRVWAA